MDSVEEPSTFFGRCKCCLDYGCVKNIWMQYEFEGVTEVYAELMKDTFSINWSAVEENSEEFICDGCVVRLREAHEFKTEVMSAEEKLYEELKAIESDGKVQFLDRKNIKLESIENDGVEMLPHILNNTEYCEVEYLEDIKEEIHHKEIENDGVELDDGEFYVLNEDGSNADVIFEVFASGDDKESEMKWSRKGLRQGAKTKDSDAIAKNCLENVKENGITVSKRQEMIRSVLKPAHKTINAEPKEKVTKSETVGAIAHNINIGSDECDTNDSEMMNSENHTEDITDKYNDTDRANETTESSEGTAKKRKWPRKKRRHEKTRFYKNYSVDDMNNCLETIREGRMTVSDAAKHYGVPRKTVSAKLREGVKMPSVMPMDEQKVLRDEKGQNFIRELKNIFSLTNVVPFKVKSAKFVCAYCIITTNSFDDPDDLRIHTMTHEKVWIKHVDIMMRPHGMNETIRVDIQTLQCTACNLPLDWEQFLSHLQDIHEVHLEESQVKLIPFKLDYDNTCALCPKKFPNFAYLDAHMNTHYRNYMCSECGDTFLSESRLKQHSQIHVKGRFPCPLCGKVFPLDKYMRKHLALVHMNFKALKCMHCDERFKSEFDRHSHVTQQHPDKVKIIRCEICGKNFDWRPYYLSHLRKVHSKVKKNKCKFCPKAFGSKYELKSHEQRHTGTGQHYCTECGKNFVTLMELRSHEARRHKRETYRMYCHKSKGYKTIVLEEKTDSDVEIK